MGKVISIKPKGEQFTLEDFAPYIEKGEMNKSELQTDQQRQINRTLAAELIQEMSDTDFLTWFEEHRAGMDELATRRISDE